MRKVLLLLTAGFTVATAQAQYSHNQALAPTHKMQGPADAPVKQHQAAVSHVGARTTATDFYTENFSSGGPGVLPTGWTAGVVTGGTWKWTITPSTSAFTMGAMASSSASNGWMIFDSDSIGAACSCAPEGWLQSPPLNCSTHPYVRLNFEDYYRKFQDSCYVWVSTDVAFSTYTSYPVLINNQLATNIYGANTAKAQINISATAGSQPSVYLRFVTRGPNLGAYSWMIDDLSLSDLDSVDAGLRNSCIVNYAGPDQGFTSFGAIPSKMADTVIPVSFAANYGFTALPSLSVNAKIFQGTSSVYNENVSVNVPVNGYDTLVDFSGATTPYYYSTTMGNYTVACSTAPGADAAMGNNADTTKFNITDSTWSMNVPGSGVLTSSFIYRPGTTNRMSYSEGTRFVVPAGRTDTLTSASVAFGRTTKPGQVVGVQIYHFDGAWIFDGTTYFRALTAGEINTSTSGASVYATFMVDEASSSGKIVLNGGAGGMNYAAVVRGAGNTDTVTVLEGKNPAPISLIGYSGYADTTTNTTLPLPEFGSGHLPFANTETPFINLNFGVVVHKEGVTELNSGYEIGKAFPNPANTMVTVPFTLTQDAAVTATLTNVMGQAISTSTVNATAGKATRATFSTASLPDGIYIYTLNFNGQQVNGRVVVAH